MPFSIGKIFKTNKYFIGKIAKAEILARKKKELDDFKLLLNAAQRFNNVKLMREYIQSKEDIGKSNGTLNDDLLNWIEWAQKKADWYDPHVDAYDELLSDVNKSTFTF